MVSGRVNLKHLNARLAGEAKSTMKAPSLESQMLEILFLISQMSNHDPITQISCDRIKVGMKEERVEGLLGCKSTYVCTIINGNGPVTCYVKLWVGRKGCIMVGVHEHRVTYATFSTED